MKMMIQADDYGITKAVTDGIVECAKQGMMTQTGIFTNMPWVDYAAERIKEVPHVLLGQDLNLSTGGPVTDPKLIPTLVQENGQFLTSAMHRQRDKENPHNVTYEDAYLEYDNQVKKFIELFDKLPGYIGGHAWSSEETDKALNDIADKYGIFNALAILDEPKPKYTMYHDLEGEWARPIVREDGRYDFSVQSQSENDPLKMFREGKFDEIFKDTLENKDVFFLHTHAGYLDRELLQLSSFSVIRPMEVGLLCSAELKKWVKDNNVELVNYLDLYKVGD